MKIGRTRFVVHVLAAGNAGKPLETAFREACMQDILNEARHIPTPVGNYSPDWAIAFYEGMVKHIFFVAETKGSMDSFDLRPIEKAKTDCARKLFNEMSTGKVRYDVVNDYQQLLNLVKPV